MGTKRLKSCIGWIQLETLFKAMQKKKNQYYRCRDRAKQIPKSLICCRKDEYLLEPLLLHFGRVENGSVIYHWPAERVLIPESGLHLCIIQNFVFFNLSLEHWEKMLSFHPKRLVQKDFILPTYFECF